MQAQHYDWLANALQELREGELRREQKRERRRARLRRLFSLRGVALVIVGAFLVLFVGHAYLGWGMIVDYGYRIRVVLRTPDRKPIDPISVSLADPDGSAHHEWHDRWNPLLKMRQPEGAYGFMGMGPICWGKDCDARWEIRAVGYEPFAFKMADHCTSWHEKRHEKGCLALDVTATLKPDASLQRPWPAN